MGEEGGFGLVELVMAIVMLNVGILAIVAAFTAGNAALSRANSVATASSLAEKQLEIFRGQLWDNIVQTTTECNLAVADSTYTVDTIYQTQVVCSAAQSPVTATCPASVPTNACDPSYLVTGPDGRSYRVDTYLYYRTPTGGAKLKAITVVVRPETNLSRSLARASSEFDELAGS